MIGVSVPAPARDLAAPSELLPTAEAGLVEALAADRSPSDQALVSAPVMGHDFRSRARRWVYSGCRRKTTARTMSGMIRQTIGEQL
jgi:hypothetical protein